MAAPRHRERSCSLGRSLITPPKWPAQATWSSYAEGLRPRSIPLRSGRAGAWITFLGYPGEQPILDAQSLQRPAGAHLYNGAFQIEGVSYIRVVNLTAINSRDAGFTIRDRAAGDLINNATIGTFASGIAAWDTHHARTTAKHIRIIGNDISRANVWEAAGPDVVKRGEPPHEALSVGGVVDFEVAYNHVHDSGKEGIDIKETSSRGQVHHNLVHNVERQGLYVDAWFGELSAIGFPTTSSATVGSRIALSAENGTAVEVTSTFTTTLIFNNHGSGMYVSRWGADNKFAPGHVANNTFYHNGYGTPQHGQDYFWQTRGIHLYSNNLRDVTIKKNIISENRGFQIGYSELYSCADHSWQRISVKKVFRFPDPGVGGGGGVLTKRTSAVLVAMDFPPQLTQDPPINSSPPINKAVGAYERVVYIPRSWVKT